MFFSSLSISECIWGPFTLLFNGHQLAPVSFLGIRRPGRRFHSSPPFSAEFKNEWSFTSTINLVIHVVARYNFTFYVLG